MSDEISNSNQSSGLKGEWSLFLQSFINDEINEEKNKKIQNEIRNLPIEIIQDQIKLLSSEKHQLFQNVEKIKQQIEENLAVIENLELVRSSTVDILKKIDDLNLIGEAESKKLEALDKKVKKLRELEHLALDLK